MGIGLVTSQYIFETNAKNTWNEFACIVTDSKLVSPLRHHGKLHRAAISVRYEDGTESFRGELTTLSELRAAKSNGGYVPDRKGQQTLVDKHPAGTQFTCFVDAQNRRNIVLELERRSPWVRLIVLFFFIGLGALVIAIHLKLLWLIGLGERPVRYKPDDNRPTGPTSFKQKTREGHEIRLRLSETSPAVGDTVNLEWQFPESFKEIDFVSINLEGREMIVRPEPSKWEIPNEPSDNEHLFYCESQRIPTALTQAGTGNTTFLIGSNLMHSFESTNHRIEWAIKFFVRQGRTENIHIHCPLTVRVGENTVG